VQGIEQLLNISEQQITYMLLLFLRVTGLFALSPVLGRRNVPAAVKIGLSLLISYIFLAVYPPQPAAAMTLSAENLLPYVLLAIKELLIGLVIGYMTTLFFDVVMMAGQVMDVQIGFGMAQIFDPDMQAQVSFVGSFLNYGLLLYFFAVNGHHALIKIMYLSFGQIPVGQVALQTNIVDVCIKAFSIAVSMAMSVALPIIAAEIILEVVMGIMIRSVPQLNIFVVGLSVKIIAGLFALMLLMPFFAAYGDKIFAALFTWIDAALKGMIPT
jgi:flagellar biosynthetic protein FliR